MSVQLSYEEGLPETAVKAGRGRSRWQLRSSAIKKNNNIKLNFFKLKMVIPQPDETI